MAATVEKDTTPMWAEPFAAMYWRIRVQTYLLVMAFGVVLAMGYWLYDLGNRAAAHVYEVRPDGQAIYVGEREGNLAPRAVEAAHVARQFAELVYGWNSSTIHEDLAEAVNMCSMAMAAQFRDELADAAFVGAIRRREIRSEVVVDKVEVLEHSRQHAKVRVAGQVHIFPLTEYEGRPIDNKSFANVIVLATVPRDPELRPNGLEVVRMIHEPRGNKKVARKDP